MVRPKAVFPIVAALAAEGHGAKRVCRLLRLAPSGFFRWRSRPPTARMIRRAWLADVIGEVHERSRRTYGMRRIRAELADSYGQVVNKKLIRSIMSELGISGLPKRKRPKAMPTHPAAAEDLVRRNFVRKGPNQLWMTDITEHPTREGKLYCCVVLDAWSREGGRLVGRIEDRPRPWSTRRWVWRSKPRPPPAGTTVHSDHGSQYTSWTFSQRVRSAGLAHSLGTVGDAYDNAAVESFWARMQTELFNTRTWATRVELSTAIFDWIEDVLLSHPDTTAST